VRRQVVAGLLAATLNGAGWQFQFLEIDGAG
jgi:hypothetical protein